MFEVGIFYFFAAIAIFSACLLIITKHPVISVLLLMTTFLATSVLWLLLEAEFLALSLILIYVGAVIVLFLFVVLMLDVEVEKKRGRFVHYLPLGICLLVVVLILLVYAIGPRVFGLDKIPLPVKHGADYSNITELGLLLFSKYLFHFEVAGVLLLVGIVSAIALISRGVVDRKKQNPAEQVKANKKDRLRLINVL